MTKGGNKYDNFGNTNDKKVNMYDRFVKNYDKKVNHLKNLFTFGQHKEIIDTKLVSFCHRKQFIQGFLS
jgi:hypothetical protein